MHYPDFERDLARWIPVLIDCYRRRRKVRTGFAPPDRLNRQETDEIVAALRQLTNDFSHTRRLVGGGYMDVPALLGAYLLYFWPISYVQARYCLHQISLCNSALQLHTAIDLCSGPGPMAMALCDAGAKKVMVCDHSRPALDLARYIAGAYGLSLDTCGWDAEKTSVPGEGRCDCMIVGHAVNEWWSHDVNRIEKRCRRIETLLHRLNPGGTFVVIEPALKQTARELAMVRDAVMGQNAARVVAPCVFRGPCPTLSDPTAMCYAAYRWKMPPLAAALVAAAGTDRHEVKMAWLCLTPSGGLAQSDRADPLYRVVSGHMLNKAGRSRVFVCGPQGRIRISAHRNDRFPAATVFFTLERGEKVFIDNLEKRGDNWAVVPATVLRRCQ